MLNLAPKNVSSLLDLRSRSEIYLFAGPCDLGVREATDLIGLVSVLGEGGGVLIGWHCAN